MTPLQKAGLLLVDDFKSFQTKIANGDASKLNYIELSDRLLGLQAFQPPSENFSDYIAQNRDRVNEQVKDSLVFSEYDPSGVHFRAIVQPTKTTDADFQDAINTLRNDRNEFQCLQDVLIKTNWKGSGGYYAVDLYAEDMLGQLSEIKVDDIKISDTPGMKVDPQTDRVTGVHPFHPKDPKLDSVLQQYNRSLANTMALPNKKWSLFVFPGGTVVTPDLALVVEYKGRHVVLRNYSF